MPRVDDTTSIQFADIFGTGTACLVLSYPYGSVSGSNYKVLDFCGGYKPHLLTEMSNNMGATTRAQYAPSTEFYLEDKKNGCPWVTNLPFPVQVLEKTEVIDHISKNKIVTTYKYHHGYFDGTSGDRAFRGFGRVDQFDTQYFNDFTASGLRGDNASYDNMGKGYYVSPVETRNWFHTGIYFDPDRRIDARELTEQYKREYYCEDHAAFDLQRHVLERHDRSPVSGSSLRDAYRALRGTRLRTEVFARDETDKKDHPYLVSEYRYRVKEIQPQKSDGHPVYLTYENDSLSYHYERNPADPRIGHSLTLHADKYGNVDESVSIGYPRRQVRDGLSEQGEIKIVYTRSDFINKDDPGADSDFGYYYVGLPCQTRTYEITGINWTTGDPLLDKDDFPSEVRDKSLSINLSTFNGYESERPQSGNGEAGVQRRIIEWTRAYFLKEDAENIDIELLRDHIHRADLGDVESLGLPYESYKAAFTREILNHLYSDSAGNARWTDEMLEEGGYYKEDGYWWIPSGLQKFEPKKFHLPTIARNPFGEYTRTKVDEYALLPKEVVDAKGNITAAVNDYRVLRPRRVEDPNQSLSEVEFDALGLVVGTAISGKDRDGNPVGDSLKEFVPDLSPETIAAHLQDPLNLSGNTGAHSILKKATTRLLYDLKLFLNSGGKQPPVVCTLAREIHSSEEGGSDSAIQHSFVYSDGFGGREVQTKVQAGPGEVNNAQVEHRWIATGTRVFNNKVSKPVRQFEPYFSDSHEFGIERHGVSPVLFYDPIDRIVCKVHPNKTYEKVEFDPWLQRIWDPNDTVLLDPRSDSHVVGYVRVYFGEQDQKYPTNAPRTWYDQYEQIAVTRGGVAAWVAEHAATPTTAHLDTLGSIFLTVQDNGPGAEKKFGTRVILDIEGKIKKLIDPRNIYLFENGYDIALFIACH